MDKRMEELKKQGLFISKMLECSIKREKVFAELVPILKKIGFENVSYTYKFPKEKEKQVLAIMDVPMADDEEFVRTIYITFNNNEYRLDIESFFVLITSNIKNIKLILKGLLRLG